MRESVTYQMILEEGIEHGIERGIERGRADEARDLLISLGTDRLGSPDTSTRIALDAIQDRAALERLVHRLFETDSWSALLARDGR
jgi:predicted transposase YdaD